MKVALGICLMLVVVGYIQAAPTEKEVLLRRLIDALEETKKNEVVCKDNPYLCEADNRPYCNHEVNDPDWRDVAEYLQEECPVLCGTCDGETHH